MTILPHLELPVRGRVSHKRAVFAAVATLLVEIVLIWVTAEVGPSMTIPILLVLAVGIIGVGVTVWVHSHLGSEPITADPTTVRRRGPHPAWLAVVGTVVMVIAGFSWVLSLKMWMAEGAATQVAKTLMESQTCSTSQADLASVGSVMSATKVCGSGAPDAGAQFEGHTVVDSSTGDQVEKGLLYAPDGFAGLYMTCVRHLVGSWWVFQDLVLNCPSGYQVVGSSP